MSTSNTTTIESSGTESAERTTIHVTRRQREKLRSVQKGRPANVTLEHLVDLYKQVKEME